MKRKRLTEENEEDANGREEDANPVDSDWNDEDCEEQPGWTKFSLIASITRSALRRSSSTSSTCSSTTITFTSKTLPTHSNWCNNNNNNNNNSWQCLRCCHHYTSHCESSPGSSGQCQMAIYIRLLCFAVTEQLDMNIKSKKNIKHIYNNTMQCNIIRGLNVVI